MRMKRVAIKCHANLNTGEGKVIIEDFFHDLDSLLKADLLKDFSEIMESLYEESLKERRRDIADLRSSGDHLKEVVPTSDITIAELKGFVADAETMIKDGMHNTVKRIRVNDQENIKRLKETKNEA